MPIVAVGGLKKIFNPMFSSQQNEYMKSLGLDFDFDCLAEEEWFMIEEVVGNMLQTSGVDEDYEVTETGLLCESILDLLP